MILDSSPPWMSWFSKLDSHEAIRRAAHQGAVPIPDLGTLRLDEACRRLNTAWQEIFVPGDQHVAILEMMIGRASSFSNATFPTLRDFNISRGLAAPPPREANPIWCLTGLAGVSKSSLVKAFERVCQLQNGGALSCATQTQVVQPVRRISISAQQSVHGVLEMLANPNAFASSRTSTTRALTQHAREWLAAHATSTLVVDEMQFFTQSATASTKTSHLIMTLGNLQVPLIYVANYSLVNKLVLRPHEEKNRLLASPIVLLPPSAGDQSWADSVAEYLSVAPEFFRLHGPEEILELHRLTAGLYRALRELLIQAYRTASNSGRAPVTIADVRKAYGSPAYTSNRKDIEDLISLSVSRTMERERPDLVCPFVERNVGVQPMKKASKNQDPVPSADMSAAIIESSMSAAARATINAFRKSAEESASSNRSTTVVHMPKRGPVSAQSLLDGAALFRQSMRSGGSTRKKTSPQKSDSKVNDDNTN